MSRIIENELKIQELKIKCPLCENEKEHTYRVNFKQIRCFIEKSKPVEGSTSKVTHFFTCPITSKRFQATLKVLESKLEFEFAEAFSPEYEILYEEAKDSYRKAREVLRDFCKFMITVSISAVPIYLTLLNLVLPENFAFSDFSDFWLNFLLVFPFILFLFSAGIFTWGYLPHMSFSPLEIIEGITTKHEGEIKRTKRFIYVGFPLLMAGIVVALINIYAIIAGIDLTSILFT